MGIKNYIHKRMQGGLFPVFKWLYYRPIFYLRCCLWPRITNKPRWKMTFECRIVPGHEDKILKVSTNGNIWRTWWIISTNLVDEQS